MGAKQDLKNVADFKYISVICVLFDLVCQKKNQNKLIYFCLDFSERNVQGNLPLFGTSFTHCAIGSSITQLRNLELNAALSPIDIAF